MRYFDLHCDTLYECEKNGVGLTGNGLHVDLEKAPAQPYLQCFAAWIPDSLRGEEAFQHFCRLASVFREECAAGKLVAVTDAESFRRAERFGRGGILTIEGGAAFAGKTEHIRQAAALGVKIVTLTWNGRNELGSGVQCDDPIGLTSFGKQALDTMEDLGVVPDLSHASPRLFYDVCSHTSSPVIATHSNAKALCGHQRNLTDEQFREIAGRNGLVGVNFYRAFLREEPEKASMEDIFAHAEHFLSLGGENCVALGSDFDGSELPDDLNGVGGVGALYELFLRRGYSEELVDRIFYRNAADFLLRTLQKGKIRV